VRMRDAAMSKASQGVPGEALPEPKRVGGRRPGAGRPKGSKTRKLNVPENVEDPIEFLRAVMNDRCAEPALRVRAALEVSKHRKAGSSGKKEERQEAAEGIQGRFAPPRGPKLRAV
jgi:hypothetical protein